MPEMSETQLFWVGFVMRWYQRLVLAGFLCGMILGFTTMISVHFTLTVALVVAMAVASLLTTTRTR